ncbi:helix-turn-helix domain-containing protein [Nocardia alni]|uniref:helix-turn-helix domain-containing protein n=1 Tax=Nocardia alni TaxID=2815723 RepID=UPI001C22DE01|nr:helix-turn-helix transcriptional regulator [Nocardia alni]
MNGSAVPRRTLGRELKRLREESGVSAAAAARAIEISPQTLWRMESGRPGPKLKELYITVLCTMYGATERHIEDLVKLIEQARRPMWWHGITGVVPDHLDLFLGLEQAASCSTDFEESLVPGLLQTTEYRRALSRVECPTRSSLDVELLLEVLVRRQRRLRDNAPSLEFRALLSESVLHNQVGGPQVMGDQLVRMATAGAAPNISIRVVPQRSGAHAGLITGSFVLLDFPPHRTPHLTEPPVVYVQTDTTSRYLDQEAELERYRTAIADIEGKALNEDASRQLLLDISKEYRASCDSSGIDSAAL